MDLWEEIVQEYSKEIQNLKNMLGEGSVEDHQHYRQVVGSIQGIEWSRQKLLDILKNLNKINEEE
tara:strand:+ start:90 stop:284 length:195 start_codon:yes stop_codon:yes gene_type:complete